MEDPFKEGKISWTDFDAPLMRIRLVGTVRDEVWLGWFDQMSKLANEKVLAILIDARQLGRIPASQRQAAAKWIDRERSATERNWVGVAFVFSTKLQHGIWRAILWRTQTSIPVRTFGNHEDAEQWLHGLLDEASGNGAKHV